MHVDTCVLDPSTRHIATAVWLALAGLCGAVLLLRRTVVYVWWLAGALVLGAATWGACQSGMPMWSGWLLACAAACLAHAMALRVGRLGQRSSLVLCGVVAAVFAGVGNADWWGELLPLQGLLICGALALALVLPWVWQAPSRHGVERATVVVYTALVAAAWGAAGSSLLQNIVPVGWWPAVAGLAALHMLGILLSAAADVPLGMMRPWSGVPGAPLLQRGRWEAQLGPLPYARGVHAMVLCELDDYPQRTTPQMQAIAQQVVGRYAQQLQRNLRDGDLVARLGGAELAIALRHISAADAQALMQRITTQIQGLHWGRKSGERAVTVSYAVVAVMPHDTVDQALHRADVVLYQLKDGHSAVPSAAVPHDFNPA